jgi:hypothetical protein
LSEIDYPVFKIGKEIPSFSNGISYFLRQYKLDFGEVRNDLLLVDDTTIDEPTLAKRRLRLLENKIRLKKLSKAVFFLGDLIKLSDRKSWFIDSAGKVFQYKKTKTAKLIFRNITKMIAIKGGGSIIEVEGLHTRFKTLYAPKEDEVYAGILVDGMTNILYGVYTQLHKDTWRMI